MRTLIWAGRLMIALGAAMLVGSIAAGALAFGLLMLASLAAPGVLMVWLATGWDKPLARIELQRFGRPAIATVRKVEDAKLDGNGTRTAKLSLHVTPRNESAYKTRRRVVLPGGRIPREGETVTIKFDPNKRGEFVLLDENYEVASFPISSSTLRPPISTVRRAAGGSATPAQSRLSRCSAPHRGARAAPGRRRFRPSRHRALLDLPVGRSQRGGARGGATAAGRLVSRARHRRLRRGRTPASAPGEAGALHEGQDVFAKAGTPLVSVRAGRVVETGNDGGRGNYIAIWSPDVEGRPSSTCTCAPPRGSRRASRSRREGA